MLVFCIPFWKWVKGGRKNSLKRIKTGKLQSGVQDVFIVIVMLKLCHHIMLHFRVFRNLWGPFNNYKNAVFNDEQKRSIIFVRMWLNNPSFVFIICHHSASLMVPNGDLRNRRFYPTPTLIMDSYGLISLSINMQVNMTRKIDKTQRTYQEKEKETLKQKQRHSRKNKNKISKQLLSLFLSKKQQQQSYGNNEILRI